MNVDELKEIIKKMKSICENLESSIEETAGALLHVNKVARDNLALVDRVEKMFLPKVDLEQFERYEGL